jgi:hypothetical protein
VAQQVDGGDDAPFDGDAHVGGDESRVFGADVGAVSDGGEVDVGRSVKFVRLPALFPVCPCGPEPCVCPGLC